MIYLFDYGTLKLIWWLFVGVLLIGFAILDGFDLGVGTLLPFVGRTDDERRVMLNAIGPTWEGNQVWFITAGGATFAAWPLVYATAFSGLYVALILTLFALFFRPVGIEYRGKVADPHWRRAWDWGLFAGGTVPALVFGVAFGNLLQGLPFHFDADLRVFYTGTFIGLLNPFALLAGIVSLGMLTMHGAIYLQLRTDGALQERARHAVLVSGAAFLIAFAAAGLWVAQGNEAFRITAMPPADTAFTPLAKTVERVHGGWLTNYGQYPATILAPVLALGGALLAVVASQARRTAAAFVLSCIGVGSVVLTAGLALFPFIMPSASDPNSSLTVYDAVSSHRTLQIMFWVVVLFLPVVIGYTGWVYRVMRGTVTERKVREAGHGMY
jgi:cytochrome bd ubiquinol oxidase subunit II